jgi:hypothetical protein
VTIAGDRATPCAWACRMTSVVASIGLGSTGGNYNGGMIAVRYVALAALVMWVGGMIALPLLVAPAVSGEAIGEVWRRFHLLAYVCGATVFVALFVMKFVGPPPHAFTLRAGIVFLMLLLVTYSGRGMAPPLPVLAAINLGLGLLLLGWYVRE